MKSIVVFGFSEKTGVLLSLDRFGQLLFISYS